ncbi:hypothetical protein C8Q73DRAFT_745200 [Cubamyces lactineus]|nr:hypothetical protein C8Q73DRAFT_745200 [Cubamyces lactineus]
MFCNDYRFLANIALFAEAALIFYEYAITFNNEVRLIWRRRITAASVLYFLNRYIMILDNIVTLISFPAMCSALAWIDVVLNLLPYFIWNVFSTMRVYAVSGRDWRIAVLVCVLMLGPIISNIYNIPFEFPVNMPPPYNCSFDNTISLATHNIVPLMTADAVIIAVTWWKTYRFKKSADDARVATSLVDLLLRDGSTMLILNSLHIMMNYVAKVSFLGDVADVLTSILISRFIMNLRDIGERGTDQPSRAGLDGPGSWHATPGLSSGGGQHEPIVFTSNFFDSLGGTLEHSLWTHPELEEHPNDAARDGRTSARAEEQGNATNWEKTPAEGASNTVPA